jgi:hypothetical protein
LAGQPVQGIIDALNRIIEITVPAKYQEGGTYVIPGHGRLCEEADVVEYRDMVTIIRDRIADLIGKGRTLEQVKARATKDDRILVSNMEINGYERIITNDNSWRWTQPLEPDDVVLEWSVPTKA